MRIWATALSGLALLISIAATISLLNTPLYKGFETSCIVSGCETIVTTQTLVEANWAKVVYQRIEVIWFQAAPQ